MLTLSRRVNEKILIGKDIEITIIEINYRQVRIGVNAPREVLVLRSELLKDKPQGTPDASRNQTDPPKTTDSFSFGIDCEP